MLNKLVEQIIKSLARIIRINISPSTVRQTLNAEYQEGINDMEVKLDINLKGDPQKLDFLETYTFDNIKGMSDELVEGMRKAMSQGLLNNESVTQIKRRVNDVMKVGQNRAKMIARTETARVRNAGRYDAAIDANNEGIETRKWLLITYDDRTSEVSKKMGAKYGSRDKAIPMNENFRIEYRGKIYEGPYPPFMPNDRDKLMIEVI